MILTNDAGLRSGVIWSNSGRIIVAMNVERFVVMMIVLIAHVLKTSSTNGKAISSLEERHEEYGLKYTGAR